MLTLYGYGSPNVLKVIIALEELELSYRFVEIDPFEGDQYTDEFGVLNPNRKVPVLVDGDTTVWESGAILIYLAERYGRFLPTEPQARYATLQWLMLQMASIGPMFGQLSHFTIYAPDAEHAYARARYATEVKRLYEVMEARLRESTWLGGEDYSIADMAAWPWIRSIDRRDVDRATVPEAVRWIDAIADRPAVKRALAFFDPLADVDLPAILRDKAENVDRYVLRGKWSRPLGTGTA